LPTDLRAALSQSFGTRFRVERELGRGGMATVYLVHDAKHGRDVALKVLHPELAASLGRERFLREIAFAARLTHPNILPLYESGEAGDALFYLLPYA
jgi:serine/threonine-protein kinase